MMLWENGVEEIEQEKFIRFRTEDAFEAKVSEEADVTVLEGINHGSEVRS